MPELPEVETSKNGISKYLLQQTIEKVIIRESRLRWPIPNHLEQLIQHKIIKNITRRAKYIIIQFEHGNLVIHLGMSGHLKIMTHSKDSIQKHDHVDFILSNNTILRYHDPRRFGSILWIENPIETHKLFAHLGPEPLEDNFNPNYLSSRLKNRKIPIKNLIMNQNIVVGVGNIYANEALFLSHINPLRPSDSLNKKEVKELIQNIKKVLAEAIKKGGTTLNDFKNAEGKPGYFKQELFVYGRKNQKCLVCANPIQECRIGQRSTFYCPKCQKL